MTYTLCSIQVIFLYSDVIKISFYIVPKKFYTFIFNLFLIYIWNLFL